MRILGSICARGGSKGVKNKNARPLMKKPLIAYTIDAFKAWGKADRIICSTDSEEIRQMAIYYGAEAPFIRPEELATDNSGKLEVFQHMLNYCENEEKKKYNFFYDLDVTAPLRTVKDIDNAFNKLIESDADLIISAYKSKKNPYNEMIELDKDGYAHFSKKGDKIIYSKNKASEVYSLNASIYIFRRDFLINTSDEMAGKTILYEMTDNIIDIDREIDFEFIEFMLKSKKFTFDF